MSHRQLSRSEQFLDGVGKLEQAQEIRHRRPFFADAPRDLLLRQSELFMELVIRGGLFHRVEIFALNVLDERNLKCVALLAELLDDDWNEPQTRALRRAESALTCDELVAVAGPRHHERLHDAVLANAPRQLLDRRVVERLARLIRIRRNLFDRYLSETGRLLRNRFLLRNEGTEAAAKYFFLVHPR